MAHLEDFEKADFYKKHKTIEFDTLYEKRQYEVVAVFRSKVYKENEDVFKYYRYVGKLSKKQYETYVKNCKKLSIYKDGATPGLRRAASDFGNLCLSYGKRAVCSCG